MWLCLGLCGLVLGFFKLGWIRVGKEVCRDVGFIRVCIGLGALDFAFVVGRRVRKGAAGRR